MGEEIAAAVVLREGEVESEDDLIRTFAFERLAPFKVPRRIYIVEALPKGPTGKVARIGLAEKLAATNLRYLTIDGSVGNSQQALPAWQKPVTACLDLQVRL